MASVNTERWADFCLFLVFLDLDTAHVYETAGVEGERGEGRRERRTDRTGVCHLATLLAQTPDFRISVWLFVSQNASNSEKNNKGHNQDPQVTYGRL